MLQTIRCSTTDSSILMDLPPPPPPPPPLVPVSTCCFRLVSALFSIAASNPLPLAYILYFSPYIAKAAAFLLPLLLTTAILLLVVTATVPDLFLLPHFYTEEVPDDAPSVGANPIGTCGGRQEDVERDGVAYSGLLGVIWSELQGCVDLASQPYRRYEEEENSPAHQEEGQEETDGMKEPDISSRKEEDQAGAEHGDADKDPPTTPTPSPTVHAGVITWQEFEAIGKLYKALTRDVDVPGPPIKLAAIRCGADVKPGFLSPPPSVGPLPAKGARNGAVLTRCHSRSSPLEGWESTPASEVGVNDDDDEFFSATTTQEMLLPWRPEANSGSRMPVGPGAALGRFGGSMREGQWRRETMHFANCKSMSVHHHERQLARSMSVVAGVKEEGMDMLWEEYDDTGRKNKSGDGKYRKIMKRNKENMSRCGSKVEHGEDEEEDYVVDDDDEEAELGGGKLCCLQAVRFSTARMRFGMGKIGTGLAKVTRAIKGTTLGAFCNHGPPPGKVPENCRARGCRSQTLFL